MATNLIGTWGTIASANADSGQKKLIYDGTYWWYFYMKSTSSNTLFYAYSSDLVTWTEASTALASTTTQTGNTLSAYYDAPTGVVLVTFYTGRIRYLRGNISGTTISWNGTGTVTNNASALWTFAPGADFNYQVVLDSSRRVLLLDEYNGVYPNVEISSNPISASFADAGTAWTDTAADTSNQNSRKSKLFPLTDGNLLQLTAYNSNLFLRSNRYSGGTWASTVTMGLQPYDPYSWDSAYVSDSSIFTLMRSGASAFTFYQTTNEGTSWNTKAALTWPTGGLATNSQVSLASDGVDVWAVVIRGDANNSVSYNKYTVASNTWGGWTDVETSTQVRAYVAASVLVNKLVVTWQQTNGSNFDAYVSDTVVSTNTPIAVLGSSATVTDNQTTYVASAACVGASASLAVDSTIFPLPTLQSATLPAGTILIHQLASVGDYIYGCCRGDSLPLNQGSPIIRVSANDYTNFNSVIPAAAEGEGAAYRNFGTIQYHSGLGKLYTGGNSSNVGTRHIALIEVEPGLDGSPMTAREAWRIDSSYDMEVFWFDDRYFYFVVGALLYKVDSTNWSTAATLDLTGPMGWGALPPLYPHGGAIDTMLGRLYIQETTRVNATYSGSFWLVVVDTATLSYVTKVQIPSSTGPSINVQNNQWLFGGPEQWGVTPAAVYHSNSGLWALRKSDNQIFYLPYLSPGDALPSPDWVINQPNSNSSGGNTTQINLWAGSFLWCMKYDDNLYALDISHPELWSDATTGPPWPQQVLGQFYYDTSTTDTTDTIPSDICFDRYGNLHIALAPTDFWHSSRPAGLIKLPATLYQPAMAPSLGVTTFLALDGLVYAESVGVVGASAAAVLDSMGFPVWTDSAVLGGTSAVSASDFYVSAGDIVDSAAALGASTASANDSYYSYSPTVMSDSLGVVGASVALAQDSLVHVSYFDSATLQGGSLLGVSDSYSAYNAVTVTDSMAALGADSTSALDSYQRVALLDSAIFAGTSVVHATDSISAYQSILLTDAASLLGASSSTGNEAMVYGSSLPAGGAGIIGVVGLTRASESAFLAGKATTSAGEAVVASEALAAPSSSTSAFADAYASYTPRTFTAAISLSGGSLLTTDDGYILLELFASEGRSSGFIGWQFLNLPTLILEVR